MFLLVLSKQTFLHETKEIKCAIRSNSCTKKNRRQTRAHGGEKIGCITAVKIPLWPLINLTH